MPTSSPVPAASLWDVPAAAAYLGVRPSWLREAVRQTRVPHVRVGRHVRFLPADLEAWVAAQRVPAREEPMTAASAHTGAPLGARRKEARQLLPPRLRSQKRPCRARRYPPMKRAPSPTRPRRREPRSTSRESRSSRPCCASTRVARTRRSATPPGKLTGAPRCRPPGGTATESSITLVSSQTRTRCL
jgi:excisionase family DNA binding protein